MRNNYLFLPVRECPGSFKQSIFDRQNNVSVNLGQFFFLTRPIQSSSPCASTGCLYAVVRLSGIIIPFITMVSVLRKKIIPVNNFITTFSVLGIQLFPSLVICTRFHKVSVSK
jgi:hypothetical protein